MGRAEFANAGDATKPSPSIWADCPKERLVHDGLGYYIHEDFIGSPTGTLAAALDISMISFGGNLALSADTDTIVTQKAAEVGGYIDLETDGDDNDAVAIFSEPFGIITKDTSNKLWFEARFEIGDITGDYGFFVGIVEEAGADLDVVADAAAALVGQSYIGARIFTADPDGLDIAYKKDAGTEVVVLEDATNSTALASGDRASLVDDTEVKFGFRFDGRETIRYYINGVKVATDTIDSTYDQAKRMCAIIAIKTGTGAAESIAVDWIRYAYQSTR